jgi:hypothetical protein
MKVKVDPQTRYKVTLDLSDIEASELCNSIREARAYVDNWRSDPTLLGMLGDSLETVLA